MSKGVFWGVTFILASIFIRFVLGGDLRFAKEGIFLVSAFTGAWLFGVGVLDKRFSIPLILITLITFFNQYNSYNTAVYTQMCMTFAGILIFACANSFEEKDWKNLELFLMVCGVLHATWIFLNYFGADYWDLFGIPRITIDGHRDLKGNTLLIGAMHQPSMSGAALIGLLPFSGVFFPLILGAILLLKGSMCLLALGVGFLWLIRCARNVWWSLMAVVGVIPFITLFLIKFPEYLRPGGRLGAWKAWDVWPTDLFHRVFGFGVGYIYSVFGSKTNVGGELFRQLHCEPMELYANWGLIGIGCWVWMLLQIKDFRSPYFYAFLMLWVNSLGNLTFHLSFTSLLMIFCYARIINKKGEINA